MKCLVIGPKYNGVANIVKIHKGYLERLGVKVDWHGFKEQTFKLDEIADGVEKLLGKIDFSKYDVIDCHIGMYESEQFILPFLVNSKLPPRVLSVHNISFSIFNKIGLPKIQEAINNITPNFFNGFIFYGSHPQKLFKDKYGQINSTMIFIPPTHINTRFSKAVIKDFENKYDLQTNNYIGIIGYPSKWKDWKLLLRSFRYVDKEIDFVFAGPWWDEKLGFTKKRINKIRVRVIPEYIEGNDYTLFIKNSKFGVLSYIDYPTFQGSGTLANYIWHGKPAIVSNTTSLPEYLKDAGIVIDKNDPKLWGKAISQFLEDKILYKYEAIAEERRILFSPENYARRVLEFYRKIIKEKG
jgi:glycosyltransferase involved in cell wall biosynthesis